MMATVNTEIQTWYLDLDGDGFGNPSVPINTCVPPISALLDNTDCLDSDETVFPSAPECVTVKSMAASVHCPVMKQT